MIILFPNEISQKNVAKLFLYFCLLLQCSWQKKCSWQTIIIFVKMDHVLWARKKGIMVPLLCRLKKSSFAIFNIFFFGHFAILIFCSHGQMRSLDWRQFNFGKSSSFNKQWSSISLEMYVTSFSSISYWNNSEYYPAAVA